MSYRFQQIQHAYQVQDPVLVDMLMALSQQPDPVLMTLIPEDELTFERFLSNIFSYEFRQKRSSQAFQKVYDDVLYNLHFQGHCVFHQL